MILNKLDLETSKLDSTSNSNAIREFKSKNADEETPYECKIFKALEKKYETKRYDEHIRPQTPYDLVDGKKVPLNLLAIEVSRQKMIDAITYGRFERAGSHKKFLSNEGLYFIKEQSMSEVRNKYFKAQMEEKEATEKKNM